MYTLDSITCDFGPLHQEISITIVIIITDYDSKPIGEYHTVVHVENCILYICATRESLT